MLSFRKKKNHYWVAVWEIIKSLLCWCIVTWRIWIDYQLISDKTLTKTLISWQWLNISPVLRRYRVCSTQLSGWFSQLALTDLRFDSVQYFFPSCPSSYTVEAFLNHTLVVNFSSRMNQCFHFSIITAMTTHTGALTVLAGCKCDFLIAQVCKHRVFLEERRMFCLFFLFFFCVLQNMCRQVVLIEAVKSPNDERCNWQWAVLVHIRWDFNIISSFWWIRIMASVSCLPLSFFNYISEWLLKSG